MIILTIRTDKEESEIGLFDDQNQLGYLSWQAHRSLAETIHQKIGEILNPAQKYLTSQVILNGVSKSAKKLELKDIQGIVVFQGPGSFTGLRIGVSVANSLAYSLKVPIIGQKNPEWVEKGINELLAGKDDKIVQVYYDRPANTTKPRK